MHELEVMKVVTDDADLEDFNTNSIVTRSFEQGYLHLLAELETKKFLPIPFHQVKKDRPTTVSQCIVDNDVGRTQKKRSQMSLNNDEGH